MKHGRLIDADALRKKFINANVDGINLAIDRYALKCIDDAPTIEPEPIRCKDCKYWYDAPASDGYNSCEKDALIRHKDFYCAEAERKEADMRGDT